MNKSKGAKAVSSTNDDTESSSQNERNLKDIINDWKKKSRTDSQYDRIKHMLLSINQKPTDFKATDFFPPIPDSELASDTEERTIEKINKPRKSHSKRKLDYDNCQTAENENEHQSPSIELSLLQDGEKQRRQPLASINELTNIKSLSPIISPTRTNRNVLKLKRASLLQQITNDDKLEKSARQNITTEQINEIEDSVKENLTKSKYNTRLSSTMNNFESPQILNQSKKNPQKQAFNDSIKRKSTNVSSVVSTVNEMNEAPLGDNDQIVQGSADVFNHDNQNDKDDLDLFKPPTPPKQSAKSSITITKRKSNEPLKEMDVDLSKRVTNPKVIPRLSITKQNESMNDSQSEMINSQSNNFVRRSVSASNRTVNSTVNSSASILFKPVKRSNFKELPPAPLFNQKSNNASDSSYDDTDNTRTIVTKKKSKKLTKTKEVKSSKESKQNKDKSTSKNASELDTKETKSDKSVSKNTPEIEKSNAKKDKSVAKNTTELENVELESNKDKSVSKDDHIEQVEHFEPEQQVEEEPVVPEPIENQSIRTRNRSKITSFFSSSRAVNDQEPDEVVSQKPKSKKKAKEPTAKTSKTAKSKRVPLKDIDNQVNKKLSNKNDGYFANNKTVFIDKNSKQIENDVGDDNGSTALRRSKRAKLDKYSQPVYAYETIRDYQGNTCIVRSLVGTKEKIDVKINNELMKINHFIKPSKSANRREKKVDQEKRQRQSPVKSKKNTKTKQTKPKDLNNNESIENEPMSGDNEPAAIHQDLHHDVEPHLNEEENGQSQDDRQVEQNNVKNNNSLSVTGIGKTFCMENSMVNKSQEVAHFRKDDGAEESEALHLYFFHKHLEQKEYEACSNGVGICPLSDLDGLIRIETNMSTRTSHHDTPVTYFVQRGTCIFVLNDLISIHNEKDVIHIPSNQCYKIKNCSSNEEELAYLYFRFDNQSSV